MKFTNYYFYRYFLTDGSRFRNFSKNESNTVKKKWKRWKEVEYSGKKWKTVNNDP